MSRQIKFRAWDNQRKRLLDVIEIDWEPRGYDEHGNLKKVVSYVRALDTVTKVDVYHYDTPDEIEEILTIEQYTGLKDTNGTEIYEGDIIHYVEEDETSFNGAVEYMSDEDCPGFDIPNRDIPESFWFGSASALATGFAEGKIEVIGNIHTNPELLKANK